MRRVLLSLCMIMGITVPLSAPAHAIFGLSACEKAKKEVISLESKTIKYIKSIRGYYHTNNVNWSDDKIFILTKESILRIDNFQKEDLIPKIWKVAFNNTKCFTNTQNLRITELGKLTTSGFMSHYPNVKYKNNNYCKGAGGYFAPNKDNIKKLKECFLEDVTVLGSYIEYKSIYSY